MKRLFLFFFLLTFFLSKGQKYIPFIDTTAKWSVLVFDFINCGPTGKCDYVNYRFEGDTIISGFKYYKLWAALGGTTNYSFVELLREDTIKRKVYSCSYYYPDSDQVLYDFNLHTGDTLKRYMPFDTLLVVTKIDSFKLSSDNIIRKKFTLKSPNCKSVYTFAEGIGGDQGPFYMACFFELKGTNLVCYSKNGNTLYPDHPTDDCSKANYINNIDNYTAFKLYSTQRNSINITGNLPADAIIKLFDLKGTQILYNKGETTIDLYENYNGILFYEIISQQGSMKGKILMLYE